MAETVALVGSDTLLGRELREVLENSSLNADLRLLAGTDTGKAAGILSIAGDEPTLLLKLDKSGLAGADAVILAGDPESADLALKLAKGVPIIDVTHAAEDHPNSRLRAPMVEPHDFRVAPDIVHSIAHPAAIALALVLTRMDQRFSIARSIAHIFEPASERGTPGIDELQQQTVSLLSFKPMPKTVFDEQLSFNMLGRLGEEAVVKLEEVESRIEKHTMTLLENAGGVRMPSIRLVQAPVFHGYSISLWVEFGGTVPSVAEVEAALEGDGISVHKSVEEPPNNVGIAGHDGVSVGAVSRDRNHAGAMWMWIAADNLRLTAGNALLVAREVL